MGQWVGATLAGFVTVALVGAVVLVLSAGRLQVPGDHPDVHLDLDELFVDAPVESEVPSRSVPPDRERWHQQALPPPLLLYAGSTTELGPAA
jgi:hypothetical protein